MRRIFARGHGDDASSRDARCEMQNETQRELEDKLAYYLAQASFAAGQAERLAEYVAVREQFRRIAATWTALADELRIRLGPLT
jgi:hypothetical protein